MSQPTDWKVITIYGSSSPLIEGYRVLRSAPNGKTEILKDSRGRSLFKTKEQAQKAIGNQTH